MLLKNKVVPVFFCHQFGNNCFQYWNKLLFNWYNSLGLKSMKLTVCKTLETALEAETLDID